MPDPDRLIELTSPAQRPAPSAPDVPRVETIAAFGAHASRALARCRRDSGRLSVLWIEAELKVNPPSAWSESARQELMRALSRRLHNRVRGCDEVLQVGEDCFAVLLAAAGPAEAALVEERLRQALKGNYVLDSLLVRAALCMGFATYPEAGRQGPQLAEAARLACIANREMASRPVVQTSSHSLRM